MTTPADASFHISFASHARVTIVVTKDVIGDVSLQPPFPMGLRPAHGVLHQDFKVPSFLLQEQIKTKS